MFILGFEEGPGKKQRSISGFTLNVSRACSADGIACHKGCGRAMPGKRGEGAVMGSRKAITKEQIIDVAYEKAQREGLSSLSVRESPKRVVWQPEPCTTTSPTSPNCAPRC